MYFDKLMCIFYPLSVTAKLNELDRIENVHRSRTLVSYSLSPSSDTEKYPQTLAVTTPLSEHKIKNFKKGLFGDDSCEPFNHFRSYIMFVKTMDML